MEEKKYLVIDGKQTRIEDLTGRKFGKLTVIRFDEERYKKLYSNDRREAYWFVKCDCNSNKNQSVSGGSLKSGKTISCGCSRRAINRETKYEELTGLIFGNLTVISLNEEVTLQHRLNGQRIRFWNCKCSCGNEEILVINGESLKYGKTKSCGCLKVKTPIETAKKKALNGNSIGNYIINKYGEDNLYNIWDKEKNKNLNPFLISRGSKTIFYAKCDNNCEHDSYPVKAYHFTISESRCPICYGTPKLTQEEFEDKVKALVDDEYIVLGEYISLTEKVLIKHNIKECGHIYSVNAGNFLYNTSRCPVCNESKGERKIRKYLENSNIKFNSQQEYEGLVGINNGNLSYDFIVNDTLIEYQGEQHDHYIDGFHRTYADFEKQLEHDRRKRQYAKDNNIKLLEIWYWDFDNIEEILKTDLELN